MLHNHDTRFRLQNSAANAHANTPVNVYFGIPTKITLPKDVVFLNKAVWQITGVTLPQGPFTHGSARPYVRYRIN